MRRTAGLVPFLLLAAHLVAQSPSAQPAGLIVGRVLDATDGRPLSGAVVTLTGPTATPGVPHPRILTGPDGYFVYRGLRRGRFNITATKHGYTDGAYGRFRPLGPSQPLEIADGTRIGDAAVRLWRHAAISGSVLDEAGEPQIGLPVRAFRRGAQAGRVRFLPAGASTTDDRGMFRIAGLVPGSYIVGTDMTYGSVTLAEVKDVAAGRRGVSEATAAGMLQAFGFVVAGDGGFFMRPGTRLPPPRASGVEIYKPVYHPAASAGEGATVIGLSAGQEYEGADLRIVPSPTVPVSGWLAGPDGPLAGATIRLLDGAGAESLITSTWLVANTDRAGRFIFTAVPAGQYVISTVAPRSGAQAQGPDAANLLWTEVPLSVGIEPIGDLTVTAAEGVRIRGRLEFDGDAGRSRGSLQATQVRFERVDTLPDGGEWVYITRANAQGEFISPALPGGRYYVRVLNSPEGWMFVGATADSRDVTDAPLTVLTDVHGVVLTFTDHWSGISGTVRGAGNAAEPALVIAFPVDPELWSGGANSRRNRSTRTGATGQYSLNLPPGDYYLAAVSEEDGGDPDDPTFLEALSHVATRVRVGRGERPTRDVRITDVR